MSIPELTPAETPIFDDLVIEQMQKHLDESIPCGDCESLAVIRLSARCCGDSKFMCGEHEARCRAEVTEKLGRFVKCRCGEMGPLSFDWYRVVPL